MITKRKKLIWRPTTSLIHSSQPNDFKCSFFFLVPNRKQSETEEFKCSILLVVLQKNNLSLEKLNACTINTLRLRINWLRLKQPPNREQLSVNSCGEIISVYAYAYRRWNVFPCLWPTLHSWIHCPEPGALASVSELFLCQSNRHNLEMISGLNIRTARVTITVKSEEGENYLCRSVLRVRNFRSASTASKDLNTKINWNHFHGRKSKRF